MPGTKSKVHRWLQTWVCNRVSARIVREAGRCGAGRVIRERAGSTPPAQSRRIALDCPASRHSAELIQKVYVIAAFACGCSSDFRMNGDYRWRSVYEA